MNIGVQQKHMHNTLKYMQFKIYIFNMEDTRKLPNFLKELRINYQKDGVFMNFK